LMTAGLVAAGSSTPASAICGDPQYPQCFRTQTGLTVKNVAPRKKSFTATVKAVGTNAKPTGTFVFRFKKVGGGPAATVTRAVPSSGKVTYTRSFQKGSFQATVTYKPKTRSIFRTSTSPTRSFTIK
jgi:beta-galactosidase GanA